MGFQVVMHAVDKCIIGSEFIHTYIGRKACYLKSDKAFKADRASLSNSCMHIFIQMSSFIAYLPRYI